MEAITAEEALAQLEAEAERRYSHAVVPLQASFLQLAHDMETISAVVIPDWMIGELG